MKRTVLWIALIFLWVDAGFAQSADIGSWNILNVKYNLNSAWSLFGESQLRSLRFYSNYHYYEYKGGVDFKAWKNVRLTLGAGSYQTYREGGDFLLPKNNNEIRIWPQVLLYQSVGRLKIEHRYRTELRYTSNGYRNRFRFRFGVAYPFGKERNEYKPFQVSVSNELFFTDNEPFFERNRFLVAFNYKPSKATTVQLGYLHQFDYKINDETGRDFFQIGFFLELFRKPSANSPVDTDIKDN